MSKNKNLVAKDKMEMFFKIVSGAPADEVPKEYEVDVEIAKAFVDILKKIVNILLVKILEAKRGYSVSEYGDILNMDFSKRIKKLTFIKKIKNNFCRKEDCQKILVRFV